MADSEWCVGNYKSLKISIGAIMKNLQLLRFVPDHVKTKIISKHVVKKLIFAIRFVLDWYKIDCFWATNISGNLR